MTYQLIISEETELDIEDAFEWYRTRNPRLGSEFVRAIDAAISRIGNNPFAYSKIQRQAHRILLHRFPYSLLYTINEEENLISVIGCFHSKRDFRILNDRLE